MCDGFIHRATIYSHTGIQLTLLAGRRAQATRCTSTRKGVQPDPGVAPQQALRASRRPRRAVLSAHKSGGNLATSERRNNKTHSMQRSSRAWVGAAEGKCEGGGSRVGSRVCTSTFFKSYNQNLVLNREGTVADEVGHHATGGGGGLLHTTSKMVTCHIRAHRGCFSHHRNSDS